MSLYSKIVDALKPLGIPYSVDFQGGGYTEYFTLVEAANVGRDAGDDAPGTTVVSVDVHWFLPLAKNYLSTRNEIRRALFAVGGTWPTVTVLPDRELGIRQVVFSAEYEDDEAVEGIVNQ